MSSKHDYDPGSKRFPDEGDFIDLHPAALRFETTATTKPPPAIKTTMIILHDVIKNNFDWRDNPIADLDAWAVA